MMICMKCGKEIEDRGKSHVFAGYGCYVEYHPECCPRERDGIECQMSHPPNMENFNKAIELLQKIIARDSPIYHFLPMNLYAEIREFLEDIK